jgi:hypothetical protein
MTWKAWLFPATGLLSRWLPSRTRKHPGRPGPSSRLVLEPLEDRTLLSGSPLNNLVSLNGAVYFTTEDPGTVAEHRGAGGHDPGQRAHPPG